MPHYMADDESRISPRFERFLPDDSLSRHDGAGFGRSGRDLVAGLAVAALLGQLVFAQATLLIVIGCLIVGRISRWRPLWLALPAAAGLGWTLAIGLRPALTGYLAAAGLVLRHFAGHGSLLAQVRGLPGLAVSWRRWLPGQFPLALVAGAAEAAVAGWLGRGRRTWEYRPGGLVTARNFYLAATLRRGEVATSDGCCVGVNAATGTRAAITWRAAETGVLCTSSDLEVATGTGRDLALAAIQHRKTVIVIDLAGHCDTAKYLAGQCASTGVPLQNFADENAHYDPLSVASPARATNLVMAMLDWTEVSHQQQLFCANYLNAALTLIGLLRIGQVPRQAQVLDELPGLLTPGALSAGISRFGARRQAAISSLAARAAELSRPPGNEADALRLIAAQLAGLRSASLGRPLRAGTGGTELSLGRALAERQVVQFRLDGPADRRSAAMIARLAVADLIEKLAERSDAGGRYDCLTWINGCEVIESSQLGALVGLGARTGTAVVFGTAAGAVAARMASQVNVIAVRGQGPHCPAKEEAADLLQGPGQPGMLSLRAGQPAPAHVTDCVVVR